MRGYGEFGTVNGLPNHRRLQTGERHGCQDAHHGYDNQHFGQGKPSVLSITPHATLSPIRVRFFFNASSAIIGLFLL
jgi:hypothetical protein